MATKNKEVKRYVSSNLQDVLKLNTFYKKQTLTEMLKNPRYKTHLLYLNNKVVSFAIYLPIDEKTIELIYIETKDEYQNKGNSKYFLEYLIKRLKADVFLEVNEKNEKAIILYKRLGFREISRRKDYYDNQDDAIVYKYEYIN